MSDNSKSLIVLGAGGHAKVVISSAQSSGWTVEAVYDDDSSLHNTMMLGIRIVGPLELAEQSQVRQAVIAIGNNQVRKSIAARSKLNWATVIHPFSAIAGTAKLGPGSVVFAGCVIQPDAEIGSHCIINSAASVDHDCRLGDFVHICPGARLAGGVTLESGVLVGTGACIIPFKHVGAEAIVGAGAVVCKDVPAKAVVVGTPATSRSSASTNR